MENIAIIIINCWLSSRTGGAGALTPDHFRRYFNQHDHLLIIVIICWSSSWSSWSSWWSADHRHHHHDRLDHRCHHHDRLDDQLINLVMPESLSVSEKMKLVVSRAAGLRLEEYIEHIEYVEYIEQLVSAYRVFSLSYSSASSLPMTSISSYLTS